MSEGQIEELSYTTLTVEAILLSLHYNGSNSFSLVNATKLYQLKAMDSEIKDYALCLGNISKDFTIHNMSKTGLKGNVKYFFC